MTYSMTDILANESTQLTTEHCFMPACLGLLFKDVIHSQLSPADIREYSADLLPYLTRAIITLSAAWNIATEVLFSQYCHFIVMA